MVSLRHPPPLARSLALVLGLVAPLAACKRDAGVAVAAANPNANASTNAAGETVFGANAPIPEGTVFVLTTREFGTLQIPVGEEWIPREGNPLELRNPARNITLTVRHQGGVPESNRGEFFVSHVGAQQREIPGYTIATQQQGTLVGHPATRIDGTYSNTSENAPMVMREYVWFGAGFVVMIAARGPAARVGDVRMLIDHVAGTLRLVGNS